MAFLRLLFGVCATVAHLNYNLYVTAEPQGHQSSCCPPPCGPPPCHPPSQEIQVVPMPEPVPIPISQPKPCTSLTIPNIILALLPPTPPKCGKPPAHPHVEYEYGQEQGHGHSAISQPFPLLVPSGGCGCCH